MNPPGFTPPPCPECGEPLDVDWFDVSTLKDLDPVLAPGKLRCPANPMHKVAHAYGELAWPAELTEDDRAWLRTQRRFAS